MENRKIVGNSIDKGKTLLLLLSVVFLGISQPSMSMSAEKRTIAVISLKAIAPYNDALSGFKEKLGQSQFEVVFNYHDLQQIKEQKDKVAREIRDSAPDLIFTVGTDATLFAKENIKNAPIVFSMVLDPVKSGIAESLANPGDNLTGVSLDILPEAQFRKLKEILPKLTRVGVIYNAKEKEWIKEIERTAKKAGLLLVAKPVNSESDVPAKIDEISKEADCLWAQVDPIIYNTQSSQFILLTLLRNKIPLMAFSSQYVKAGALLALECDYKDIGRQSGEIAIKVLNSRNAGSISVAFPEKTNLVINQKIGRLIGIDIPKKLLEEAKDVY